MAKRKTAQDRNAEETIAQLHRTMSLQNERIGELEARLREAAEWGKHQILRVEEHATVLLGDRDALTRALEVCSRRLASPQADRDPVRAGWRAQQAIDSPLNQKAIDPREALRRLGGFADPERARA